MNRISLIAFLSLLFAASTAAAQQGVFSLSHEELSVRIVTRWVGGGQGGYFPIRIRVINRGESRRLTFRLQPTSKHKIPVVTRTIQADRNATLNFTFRIPLVGDGVFATLQVLDEEEEVIEDLEKRIQLPAADGSNPDAPSVLIISEATTNCSALAAAVRAISAAAGYRGYRRRRSPPGTNPLTLDHRDVSRELLPTSWIDYTAVDLVVVDLDELGKLKSRQRSALLKWTHCGGTLLVFNVGEPAAASKKLARLLDLQQPTAASPSWRPADLKVLRTVESQQFSGLENEQLRRALRSRRGSGARVSPSVGSGGGVFLWPRTEQAFARRKLLLGLVVAFQGDPFVGTSYDWIWLLKTLRTDRYSWNARYGMSARRESVEFVNFLIPGVEGVPVYAFLFLMTLFTVIIGPLNYFLLWKRKRLFLLVLTIPAIAFVTSLSLFGYSAISYGFGVKSRVRSLTILDQRSQIAVTTSRVALFAGLAPADGLNFSAETAVFPIWPKDKGFENGTVDWTESQHLKNGWLRSRTRTQFLTIAHRTERGRLIIDRIDDDTLKVANGLNGDIEALLVADAAGRIYFAANLKAGGSQKLAAADKKDLKVVLTMLKRNAPKRPDGYTGAKNSGIFRVRQRIRRSMRRRMMGQAENSPVFETSRMERVIAKIGSDLRQLVAEDGGEKRMQPNTYLAILSQNPFPLLGIDDTEEQSGFHILLGYYQGLPPP
ncbi:MAG: hypothetical protein IID45_06585 [Planctomycetes bacterium]|nr:hypothetical protein [Planctomycetota bacterium]